MLKGSFAFFMSEKLSFCLPVASAEARFALEKKKRGKKVHSQVFLSVQFKKKKKKKIELFGPAVMLWAGN